MNRLLKCGMVAGAALAGLAGCHSGERDAGCGCAAGAKAAGAASSGALAMTLDQIKTLEGEWLMLQENGTPMEPASVIVFHVGSGGSSVREIMFPGTAHEMTNMYHMNGKDLYMTHYCAAGNQPRMKSVACSNGKIELKTESVTNLATPATEYMGELTLEMTGADHLRESWCSIKDGVQTEHAVFEFVRRK